MFGVWGMVVVEYGGRGKGGFSRSDFFGLKNKTKSLSQAVDAL